MAATHAKIIAGWGGEATRGRAGFVLGKHGMSTWPLPRPTSLYFGESPSGFTGTAPITDWTDALAYANFVDGPSGPSTTTLNGLAAADFTGTAPDTLLEGSGTNKFVGHTAGEAWFVVRSRNWARTAAGSVLLGARVGGGKEFLLRVSGSATLTDPAAVRRMFVSTANAGPVDSVYGGTVLADNTTYVLRYVSTGSAWQLWINGVAETLTVEADSNSGKWWSYVPSPASIELGAYAGLADLGHDGVIAFAMVLPSVLAASGASQWTRLLMNAYGA